MNEIKLNNGILMPQVGIGTFLLSPEEAYESVREALKDGYHLIDTANIYGNVVSVGRAIKDSGMKREDVFVSTKIWPSEYLDEDIVDKTLKRMNLEYIDLLFLHQPCRNWQKGYKTLVKAYKKGKIRSIGVSNFEGEFIDEVLKNEDVLPQVMQVECHPSYSQKELRKILSKEDIRLMSWYPLGGKGNNSILKNEMLQDMADRYHKSVAQIILRWHVQMGFVVIPGSKDKEHIKDNIMLDDFILEDKDMECISSLDYGKRFYIRDEEALNRYGMISPKYED